MAQKRTFGEVLRENGLTIGAAAVMLALVAFGVRFAARSQDVRPKPPVRTMTAVIKPDAPPSPPKEPPPPKDEPKDEPKEEEEPKRLIEVKSTDVPPPDLAKSAPAGGAVALAGDATGESDAFGLEGSRSGRSLLGSGGVGDGGGEGIGTGSGDGNRYGWYFGRIATQISGEFQRNKKIQFAEARVEIKIWLDPSGEVTRIQLLRSTGDAELDRAIEGVRLRLRDAPPADLPNPSVYRFIARKAR